MQPVKSVDTSSDIRKALGIGRLFDTIRDAVVVAELHAETIVMWNMAASRMFGYSADEAMGLPLEALVPERLRHDHRNGLARYRETGSGDIIDSHQAIELPALRKDGTEFYVDLMLSPIDDAEVPGIYVIGVLRDVTERKQLEATKDNFIANAAHELRTPVTAVLGSADLIARWRKLPEDLLDECVMTLNRQTQRLSALVRNMLDLSRLQRKRSDIRLRSIDLGDVVAKVVEASPAPPGKEVTANVGSCMVVADPERLDQIVTNLLVNAYMYGGSSISLECRRGGDSVFLTVADDGEGVPDSLLPLLFEPFSRGENTAGIQGSGLGLTIVRMLAEAMGGQIWYDGREGARFTLRLNSASESDSPAQSPSTG
jgi:PAS domain S-box-containing protein